MAKDKISSKKVSVNHAHQDEKIEKVKRVAAATLNIIWQNGIRYLSPTRVARSAKVSRPWIYKYIGGSKEALMASAVDYFGRLFSRIDQSTEAKGVEGWMNDEMRDLQKNFALSKECPWILPLYYHFKGSQNVIGRGIEKIEAEYLDRKAVQLRKVIGVSPATSRLVAELMATYKLATVHRWQTGELQKLMSQEELTQRLRLLLEFVANLGHSKSNVGNS